MSESERSPLARLVLFLVLVSVAGMFVAGMHYVLVDGPNQYYASHPPANTWVTVGPGCDNLLNQITAFFDGSYLAYVNTNDKIRRCVWEYR